MQTQLLEQPHTTSIPRWQWLLPALAALLLLTILPEPAPIASEGFDPSWCYALNQQQGLGQHLGRDLLHVWGPAGIWMMPWPSSAHVIGCILAGLALRAAIIAASLLITRHSRRPLACTLILLAACWFLPETANEPAVFAAVLLLIVADLLRPRWYLLLPAGVLAGIFATAKFNLFVGLTSLSLAHALGIWHTQRSSWRAPAARLGTFALTLLIAIICGFGSMAGFARWVTAGLDLSSGNSEVMSLPAPPGSLWYATVCGLLLTAMLWSIAQKAGRRMALAWAPLMVVLFYLSFKHGYVRGDAHVANFHQAMPLLAASGLLIAPGRRILALALCVTIVSAIGLRSPGMRPNLRQFTALKALSRTPARWHRWQAFQHQAIAEAADRAAPLRHQLAGHTADIIPMDVTWLEGIDCTWSPAPYFQMSLVRSLHSDQSTAAHFAGPTAPERLLLSFKDLDGRNLMHTAPLAMEAILSNYHHLASDQNTVLLERGAHWRLEQRSLGQQNVRWGQDIELPPARGSRSDQILAVRVHAWHSNRGKLEKVLYRIPPLSIEIDNHPPYRFIAPTAPSGIWVRGLPRNTTEFSTLLQTGCPDPETLQTRHFRLLQDPDDPCFLPELAVEFIEIHCRGIEDP